MNPIPDPNPVFARDADKFVFQEPDTRQVNPALLNVKPFKVKRSEKPQKTKDKDKKKEEGKKKKPHGFFDLFNPD